MKATEQYLSVLLFIMLYKWFLKLLSLWMNSWSMTIPILKSAYKQNGFMMMIDLQIFRRLTLSFLFWTQEGLVPKV